MVIRFDRNRTGRDFVVGDIHGCFKRLETSLWELSFDESKDRLFSVGDLVDRGPDSELCKEWLSRDWFYAVRGNHEQMAIDSAKGLYGEASYAANGGSWFLALPQHERRSFSDLFENLPLVIEVETDAGLVGIVHADCPCEIWSDFVSRLDEREIQNCAIWSRDRIIDLDTSGVEGIHALYVGHTPLKSAKTLGNVHFIDTGAVFNGAMTIERIQ